MAQVHILPAFVLENCFGKVYKDNTSYLKHHSLSRWNGNGVCVWDEHKQEEFNLHMLLFVTINDWPALSNLSGQTNKGSRLSAVGCENI